MATQRKKVVRGTQLQKIRGLLRHLEMVEGDADAAAFHNVAGKQPTRFVFYDPQEVIDALRIIKNRCLFALNVQYSAGTLAGQSL